MASVYDEYSHFNQSTPFFARIALEYDDVPEDLRLTSANLLLDSYQLIGETTKVAEWARRFLASPKLSDNFKKEMRQLLEKTDSKRHSESLRPLYH